MAKENNKDRILKLLKECKNHQTAESIAVQLNMQRNTASGILNEFVREGIVQKEKTRPVIFSYIQPEDQLPEDPFTTFIGADQSLKDAVEKCKLSAGYPTRVCRFYYLDQVELEKVFWQSTSTNMQNSLEQFQRMLLLLY